MVESADAAIPQVAPQKRRGDAVHAAGARDASRGVPASILIGTIAVLVILVSLPRFRAHALEANRTDARVALNVLGTVVFDPSWTGESGADGARGLLRVIESTPPLAHRFPDARAAAESGQLVHHGYRFDTGMVRTGVTERPALVAWPDEYGKSGDVAYALASDGRLWGHLNGGLWTAGDRGLVVADLSDEGWVLLRTARGD
jgi:hypothetical protein